MLSVGDERSGKLVKFPVPTEPIGTAPDSAACDCGETVDPLWNPLFRRWIVNSLCDPCIYTEAVARVWGRTATMRRSYFTQRVPTASFDSYACPPGDRAALRIAQGWTPERGLYFVGEPGHGKTHLAVATARAWSQVATTIAVEVPKAVRIPDHYLSEVVERIAARFPDGPPSQQRIFVFVSAPDLLDRLRSTFDRENNESTEMLMRELMDADLLVLDDLGAEKSTEWASEKLFRIIDGRFKDSRPIIVTSNLKLSQIGRRYQEGDFPAGERLASRIAGACTVVDVTASGDYRFRSHA